MKQFTSVHDVPDVRKLLDLAFQMKKDPHGYATSGKRKTLGLIFLNASLRTRLSTQKAAKNLGMDVLLMNMNQDGWKLEFEDQAVMDMDKAEHIREAAAVISLYCDIIGIRSFASLSDRSADYADQVLNAFCQYAQVPVVSLESAVLHPLQSLADLMTICEKQGTKRPKVVLSWAPHPKALPQAVANSFAQWMQAAEMDFCIANPPGFDLSPEYREGLKVFHDQEEALKGADFVYVKNWSSYEDYGKPGPQLSSWTVNADKMKLTNGACFMHCLPVRRNVVVADEVLDSEQSLVIEQANNRTFAAQAVLYKLLDHES